MTQLTFQLSDEIAQQVRDRAAQEGVPVEDFVASIVKRDVAPDPVEELQRLAPLSDDEVLALADYMLSPEEDRRLQELLVQNRERLLTAEQGRELAELMALYNEGMLKKAMGWAEAVRRKLREPIRS
ncbi:MAG TPA: hypothetical protein VFV87_09530 [Pirellulaceae bacterium]|nr:hypothetical protein [Pirellulaceae bacterium]